MPMTAKQKLMERRRRRTTKLRELKAKYKATQDSKVRERLLAKMRKLSPFETVAKK
jgi:hypothetical protein